MGTVAGGAGGVGMFVASSTASWAEPTEDPFAKMDAIAKETYGSTHSNYPNAISPLPTNKRSAQELTADTIRTAPPVDDVPEESDLEKALKESQRQKKIEPRTHG